MTTLAAVTGLGRQPLSARRALVRTAERLGLRPDWLSAVIAAESGWRPDAMNPASHAVGLIQFLPSTARLLGTSADALRKMGAAGQMVYVERYFRPHAAELRRLDRPHDYYLAVFAPIAIGRGETEMVYRAPAPAYQQNRNLDADGDGEISVREAAARTLAELQRAESRPRLEVPPAESILPKILVGASVARLLWRMMN